MSENEPITYQVIMTRFKLEPAQVKGLLQRKPAIKRIRRLETGQAVYPDDTLEKIAARLLTYQSYKYNSPKVPNVIKALGASGAEEKVKREDAARLQAAYARREPSAVSQPPAGNCQYPGCEKPARIGRYCANANHYARRWVEAGE